ncbi:replication initiation protein [Piscirickettsia litoralis]|uniref:Initiator Rep protein WH1 domain-containing protein n=1 Tax=Piscirickettsia litoralis TaxID=1891921 RepID=A0ABX2ZX88_9GAMM|nr:replication initiation protein [Piscirickettsia litoralis]ODN41098.1 hypothetical protein BGC07_18300 [Piscirickettsia litoralis]
MSNEIVVKSNKLIEAGFKLSLQEQRILLMCISKVDSRVDLSRNDYIIRADEYAEQFSLTVAGAYQELKSIVNSLFERKVKVYDAENAIQTNFRWLSQIDYFDKQGQARLKFSEQVAPLLSNLKSAFTSYELRFISGMRSSYSIRIYELLKQFGDIKKRTITLDWLRDRLEIQNEKSYQKFNPIKQRILEPAKADINKHTDIEMDYTPQKTGRRITAITFTFTSKIKSRSEGKKAKEPLDHEKLTLKNFSARLLQITDRLSCCESIDTNKFSFIYNKFCTNGNTYADFKLLVQYLVDHDREIDSASAIEEIVGQRLYLGFSKPKFKSQKRNARVTNPLSQSYYHEQKELFEEEYVYAEYEEISG